MNERIKELVRQAADYANTYSDAGADVWFEMYNKKFAELIVQECARIAKLTEEDDGDDYKSGRQWAGIDVLKYFGVEE